MTLSLILMIVIGHWVADFVCQTDEMALNKSKSLWALSHHVYVYAFVMFWFVGLGRPELPAPFWGFMAINIGTHFIQDAFTSRWTSKLWFIPMEQVSEVDNLWYAYPDMKKRHNFFVVIGLDQLLHYITLFTTAAWLLK